MDQPRGTHNLWGPLHLPHKKSSPSIRNITQKRLGYFAFTSAVKEDEVAEAPQGAEVGLKAVPALLGLQCSLVGSRLSHTRVEESVGSETAKAQCQSLREGVVRAAAARGALYHPPSRGERPRKRHSSLKTARRKDGERQPPAASRGSFSTTVVTE